MLTTAEAAVALIFLPLLSACAIWVSPSRLRIVWVLPSLLAPPLLLWPIVRQVASGGTLDIVLGGHSAPLGIGLHVDGLTVFALSLTAGVGGIAGLYALAEFSPSSSAGQRFWPVWLVLMAGLNGLYLSADLFNLYVAFELVTLSSVALVASKGSAAALRAAMRYLLVGLLASLVYLLGVALLYGSHGSLDLYLLAPAVSEGGGSTLAAASLMTVALLIKGAVFPLHLWLPPAHGRAPAPVSAVLSTLVVKCAIYLLWRLWFWTGAGLDLHAAGQLVGALGAFAVLYGGLAALAQTRLKPMIAYSTVSQIGYLMLVFPLADMLAFKGATYFMSTHGLAKGAMFLAAGNVLVSRGSDRLDRLAGLDQRLPISLFAFGIAGVSLIGLPPSGGFLAKWMLLEAAFAQGAWPWVGVVVGGSLLTAMYVFRVLAAAFRKPSGGLPEVRAVPWVMSFTALALALMALLAGFVSAPVLALLDGVGAFPGVAGAP